MNPSEKQTEKHLYLPRCPYCGRRLNLVLAFGIKREGEYRCANCGGISNIQLDRRLYPCAAGAVALSAVMLLVSLLQQKGSLLLVLLVVLPFVALYALSPLFVRLHRPVIRRHKRHHNAPGQQTQADVPADGQTRAFDSHPDRALTAPAQDSCERLAQELAQRGQMQFYPASRPAPPVEDEYGSYREPLWRAAGRQEDEANRKEIDADAQEQSAQAGGSGLGNQ